MYSPQNEMLARARLAELSRVSDKRAKSRSSLRIMLDARRMRHQSPAG
jgi:hypothetical protein